MPPIENIVEQNIDASEISIEELQKLFDDEEPSKEETTLTDNTAQPEKEDITTTKSFSKRLNEEKTKIRTQQQEEIAKELGYESYADMIKQRNAKLIEDKGLDVEKVAPIVEELVKDRLNNDPRMKELEELRKEKIKEFGKAELATITKLTNGEITDLKQLPKAVLDLWAQKGSLKAAYLEVEGEKLITKIRSEQSKGSTSHLATPSGATPSGANVRPLSAEEKNVWKSFFPNLSDEELNKKTVNIK